jgi:hypothetical protein
LWLLAREKGFDSSKHCMVIANKTGNVKPCVMAEQGAMCDMCKIGQALKVKP